MGLGRGRLRLEVDNPGLPVWAGEVPSCHLFAADPGL